MIVFLGGTIGNLHAHERAGFLAELAATIGPGGLRAASGPTSSRNATAWSLPTTTPPA